MKSIAYVRPILVEPHPLLRKVAKKVTELELRMPLSQQLIDDMLATMYAAPGIGLAAPQIGVLKRIIVVHVGEDSEPYAVVNPVLSEYEGEIVGVEGCLSIPGKLADVTRAERCKVNGLDRRGNKTAFTVEGMAARCFQHEVDHLDGILIVDKGLNVRDAAPAEAAPDPLEQATASSQVEA
ncbi:MAG: peptide deformylase [Candidatus Eremiobacteraeota bacterium]|nr:peptide deformylase [Candidatus Eremiobacteraeota bacterium]